MALALTRRAMVTVPGSGGICHLHAARSGRRGAIADEGGDRSWR